MEIVLSRFHRVLLLALPVLQPSFLLSSSLFPSFLPTFFFPFVFPLLSCYCTPSYVSFRSSSVPWHRTYRGLTQTAPPQCGQLQRSFSGNYWDGNMHEPDSIADSSPAHKGSSRIGSWTPYMHPQRLEFG